MPKTLQDAGSDKQKKGSLEMAKKFIPTPERVSQFLERKSDEVRAQLSSVEGRKQLTQELLKHEAAIKKLDPSFNAKNLEKQLELVGGELKSKEKFMKDVQSPEKKGFFRRSFDKVKGFVKKHPVVTVLLVLALAAGSVAGAAYLAGGWEALIAKVGLGHLYGAGGAAEAAEVTGKVIDAAKDLPDYFVGPTGPLAR